MRPDRFCIRAVVVGGGWLLASSLMAQVIRDGTIGPDTMTQPAGPAYDITQAMGETVGSNLFHSFQTFNLAGGQSANFSGAADLQNVISRVTGGASTIDGLLSSSVPNADIWLINPQGLAFGQNAQIDVPASFHASTADQVRFADGATLSITDSAAATLTSAAPEAFGFLGANPAPITVTNAALSVDTGATLSLSGGEISINNSVVGHALDLRGDFAELYREAGDPALQEGLSQQINIASLAGPGEISVSDASVSGVAGNVTLSGSQLHVIGEGGAIRIRAGELVVEDTLVAATNTGQDSDAVDVQASDLQLRDGGSILSIVAGSVDVDVNNISVDADPLTVRVVVPATDLPVTGGWTGPLFTSGDISGTATVQALSRDVTVDVDVVAQNGELVASIDPVTLTVQVSYDVAASTPIGDVPISNTFDQSITITPDPVRRTVPASVAAPGAGVDGGSLRLQSGQLSLTGSGGNVAGGSLLDLVENSTSITTITLPGSMGSSGAINITATDMALSEGGTVASVSLGDLMLELNGALQEAVNESVVTAVNESQSGSRSFGVAGTINWTVTAAGDVPATATGTLTGAYSAPISAPAALGNPGAIAVNANNLTVTGNGADAVQSGVTFEELLGNFTGIASVTSPGTVNDSGALSVISQMLMIDEGGKILNATAGDGNAGLLSVDTDTLLVTGNADFGGLIPEFTAISSAAAPDSSGDSGAVTVTAESIEIRNNGVIASATAASGSADTITDVGTVAITTGSLDVHDVGIISSSTAGDRNGGAVLIDADTISLRDTAVIDSSTAAAGNGGVVAINADAVSITGRGAVEATDFSRSLDALIARGQELGEAVSLFQSFTGVASGNFTGSAGDSGQVTINARAVQLSQGGVVSVNAGRGTATGVTLAATSIDMSDAGVISSSTIGSGNAGSVAVSADRLHVLDSSVIDSSTAASGDAGTVSVNARELLISGDPTDDLLGDVFPFTGISAGTVLEADGDGGNIAVNTAQLTLAEGGVIATTTFSNGRAGNVEINAQVLDAVSEAAILSNTTGTGNAGLIGLNTGQLTLNNAQVLSDTQGSGVGGNVGINASSVVLDNDAEIATDVDEGATGTGGNILINAQSLMLDNSSEISSETSGGGAAGTITLLGLRDLAISAGSGVITSAEGGAGNAGSITVNATGAVRIEGRDVEDAASFSRIASASRGETSGAAGSIAISAGDVFLIDGGQITVSTQSNETRNDTNGNPLLGSINVNATGNVEISGANSGVFGRAEGLVDAGNIQIDAGRRILLRNAKIETSAVRSAGGDIVVNAPELIYLVDSVISTSASSTNPTDAGGEISIDPIFLVLVNSEILAQAIAGRGGNISITAEHLIQDPFSSINADSSLNISGDVNINAPETDISGDLLVLDGSFLEAARLLASRCAQRGAGGSSSLFAGSAGVAASPRQSLSASFIEYHRREHRQAALETDTDWPAIVDANVLLTCGDAALLDTADAG